MQGIGNGVSGEMRPKNVLLPRNMLQPNPGANERNSACLLTHRDYTKKDSPMTVFFRMDLMGFEPTTSALRTQRSPN